MTSIQTFVFLGANDRAIKRHCLTVSPTIIKYPDRKWTYRSK